MVCPPEVLELVNRFGAYRDKYKSGDYNETQLRNEFLNPFFEALGWDIYNKAGYSEGYKDVIHEDRVKIKGVTKAPDYSFRIGTERKFFVEAKKPSVNVREDPGPALQIRRYGWNAKLPVSILTDFEEFAIYDCTIKPGDKDDSGHSRIFYCKFSDYEEKWDWIVERFSKNGILHGGLDTYTEELVKGKAGKGTVTVDKEFLASLETWREALAKNIALRNPDLSIRELNDAVTKTIDRLVFLRICEDRGIEREDQLRLIGEGKDIYTRLTDLFRYADDKFNSGLFHFSDEKGWDESPDMLTLSLKIDDKILKDIISGLYYPKSQFEFSVMPADILGQVYEQFLGKVIRLTEGHQAKVEEKPEVRKAGGVYYTPTYIVDYIVRHTVGDLVRDKTPKELASLRVLDPACGSGSFLIGAYQFLLDWHLLWYMEYLTPLLKAGASPNSKEICDLLPAGIRQVPVKGKKGKSPEYPLPVFQVSETDWKLTTDEKKRILINNMYGVDIDPQAVEVTKLSLLLKVLEGERAELINTQLKITAERVLPSLHKNIKCGNSLIGSDILSQITLDGEEIYRVNPFDWEREFPEIITGGGFDAVIGNPPYIRIQTMKEWAAYEVNIYKKIYCSAQKGNYDIYVIFIEKGSELLNQNGRLGFILPHKFFTAKYGGPIREYIYQKKTLHSVVHFGHQQIFSGATTYTCLLFLSNCSQPNFSFISVTDIDEWKKSSDHEVITIPIEKASTADWIFVSDINDSLMKKIEGQGRKLAEISHTFVGTQTSAEDIFVLRNCTTDSETITGYSKALNESVTVEKNAVKWFLKGKNIRRYLPPVTDFAVVCPYEITSDSFHLLQEKSLKTTFPLAYTYLLRNKKFLMEREKGRFNGPNWFAYGYPKSMILFQRHKIICPFYDNKAAYSYDVSGFYFKTGYGIILTDDEYSDYYLLGLLNSRLLFWYYLQICTFLSSGYAHYMTQYIEQLPIAPIGRNEESQTRIISLVENLLELYRQLPKIKADHERSVIERQIDATDRAIDKLVYELYGLTDDEIRVIEERVYQ